MPVHPDSEVLQRRALLVEDDPQLPARPVEDEIRYLLVAPGQVRLQWQLSLFHEDDARAGRVQLVGSHEDGPWTSFQTRLPLAGSHLTHPEPGSRWRYGVRRVGEVPFLVSPELTMPSVPAPAEPDEAPADSRPSAAAAPAAAVQPAGLPASSAAQLRRHAGFGRSSSYSGR